MHSRPDRRYSDFRGQYKGLYLIHLRVNARRVLLTDFDNYHAVLNNAPCAPAAAENWPTKQIDAWIEAHWDDPAEEKQQQWHDT